MEFTTTFHPGLTFHPGAGDRDEITQKGKQVTFYMYLIVIFAISSSNLIKYLQLVKVIHEMNRHYGQLYG